MAIRKYKPTTPGRRGSSVSDFAEITRSTPEKSLLRPLSKTGGRNGHGRITTRHKGGGHKRQYRVIDFRRNDKDGVFATVYLSPRDYHRVHMPWTGTLRETVHVPGRLFSVGPDAVGSVSRLFARNERLVCHFDCDFGPMALVMVGALLVSGVETVWGGVEIPPYGGPITVKDYRGKGITLERFAEMARFNYGSTVIVLLPRGVAELAPQLASQLPVRLGERLATRA